MYKLKNKSVNAFNRFSLILFNNKNLSNQKKINLTLNFFSFK